MKILMIGDVVGNPGRRTLKEKLMRLKYELGVAAVVVNAENAAAGSGITVPIAQELFAAGADAITMGDHTWGQKEFAPTINQLKNFVRPANYPPAAPGKGWCLVTTPICRFALINLLGRVFMQPADCPFRTADALLREIPKDVPVFLDFHAEATSEKLAMGYFLEGRASAVWGTHTHVQTSDCRVLPGGTGYITDLGMTGPARSVLGIDVEQSINKFLGDPPRRYVSGGGPAKMECAVFELDAETGKCLSAEALRIE